MKSRWWLLLIATTGAALFAGTWYFFGRERPQPDLKPQAKQKAAQELLVGVWHATPRTRNGVEIQETLEFTPDGKMIIQCATSIEGTLPPIVGVYEWRGDHIWFHIREGRNNPEQTYTAVIESITETRLVLIKTAEQPQQYEYSR